MKTAKVDKWKKMDGWTDGQMIQNYLKLEAARKSTSKNMSLRDI